MSTLLASNPNNDPWGILGLSSSRQLIHELQSVLGVTVLVYAVSQLVNIRIPTPSVSAERIWTPIVGLLSVYWGRGRIFRPTGDYVPPGAEGDEKEFISSAAMLYLIGIVPVFGVLVWKGSLAELNSCCRLSERRSFWARSRSVDGFGKRSHKRRSARRFWSY